MNWQDELERKAAQIPRPPEELALAGRQSQIMGPPKPWSDEDTENLARLTEVLQERDAARREAKGWFKATKVWCKLARDQKRTNRWLVWALFAAGTWIVVDALCHWWRR